MSVHPSNPEGGSNIVVVEPGAGRRVQITDDVCVDFHVGTHIGTVGLTTGLVTFRPGAQLPRHTHIFTESLIVLEGRVRIDVEGRQHSLSPLDSAVFRPGMAHQNGNASGSEPAYCHIIMAMSELKPSQTRDDTEYKITLMPDDSGGYDAGEKINRLGGRSDLEIVCGFCLFHLFDADRTPGTEISGALVSLEPGQTLPILSHSADASICALRGDGEYEAEDACGRLNQYSTAFVPTRCECAIANQSPDELVLAMVQASPRMELFCGR